MESVFDKMGYYWAEIADQSNTDQQIQFLEKRLERNKCILDLACGTGRHSIALSEKGYFMVGIDHSKNLLNIAKKQSKIVNWIKGDIRFLPFKAQTFSAVISMDTSLGYFPSDTDDLQALTEVKNVLRQNCLLILDVFNQSKLLTKYQAKLISKINREYPSFFLLQERKISTNGKLLCDSWTIQEKNSGEVKIFEHSVRLYLPKELKRLAQKAGFLVYHMFGDYEGKKYNAESPRLILLAKVK